MNSFIKDNYNTIFATITDRVMKFSECLEGMKAWEEGKVVAGRIVLKPWKFNIKFIIYLNIKRYNIYIIK